jgi:hypothetical protein
MDKTFRRFRCATLLSPPQVLFIFALYMLYLFFSIYYFLYLRFIFNIKHFIFFFLWFLVSSLPSSPRMTAQPTSAPAHIAPLSSAHKSPVALSTSLCDECQQRPSSRHCADCMVCAFYLCLKKMLILLLVLCAQNTLCYFFLSLCVLHRVVGLLRRVFRQISPKRNSEIAFVCAHQRSVAFRRVTTPFKFRFLFLFLLSSLLSFLACMRLKCVLTTFHVSTIYLNLSIFFRISSLILLWFSRMAVVLARCRLGRQRHRTRCQRQEQEVICNNQVMFCIV